MNLLLTNLVPCPHPPIHLLPLHCPQAQLAHLLSFAEGLRCCILISRAISNVSSVELMSQKNLPQCQGDHRHQSPYHPHCHHLPMPFSSPSLSVVSVSDKISFNLETGWHEAKGDWCYVDISMFLTALLAQSHWMLHAWVYECWYLV